MRWRQRYMSRSKLMMVLAVGLGRDHRGGTAIVQVRPEPVRVERFVAEQSAEGDTLDQRRHADSVVVLAGQQDEAHQIAEGVDKGDDLGRQAAARAADGLGPGPPLAPLAFWWAVTMVPSTRAYSKSGSPDRHAKTRSNTPPFTQRRKRWKTLFHLPKSLGQIAPGRARPHPPQHRLEKQPVVLPRAAGIGRLARQQRRHLLPSRVAHHEPISIQHAPSSASPELES